jgi:hypothetical protein
MRPPFLPLAASLTLAALTTACGGKVVLDSGTMLTTTGTGGTGGAAGASTATSAVSTSAVSTSAVSTSGTGSGGIPDVCVAAANEVDWSTCAGAPIASWAQPFGTTWPQVYEDLCANRVNGVCQMTAETYYQCMAANPSTCSICPTEVPQGGCTGGDGIAASMACASDAVALFSCLAE